MTDPLTMLAELAAEVTELRARVAELERDRGSAAGCRWLTLEQAAERLGCSADAVRMRVKRGRLEARRHGRRIYVSAASVDDLGGQE